MEWNFCFQEPIYIVLEMHVGADSLIYIVLEMYVGANWVIYIVLEMYVELLIHKTE